MNVKILPSIKKTKWLKELLIGVTLHHRKKAEKVRPKNKR